MMIRNALFSIILGHVPILLINEIYCQGIPNVINLINVSSNKNNFEKFMMNNNFVLTDLDNDNKTYTYDCLVCDPDGHISDIRPSLDPKYETKYFSRDYPFLGKSLTLSQFVNLTGYSKEQAIDSLTYNENITAIKLSDKVYFEPTLDFNSCYSWQGSDHQYGWEFDEETKQASIWVYRTARIYSDCSDNEKISTISIKLEIQVFDNRLYEQIIKNLSPKCVFVENTKTTDGLAQKYYYTNVQDKRKYIIYVTKSLEGGGGTFKIFWDSNPKSEHSDSYWGY
jgi:hypothetical protein